MQSPVTHLGSENRTALHRLAEALGLPALEPGWVWLAGAGPGDPGLTSLLTLHAISQADVIVTDALVNRALWGLARPDTDVVHAGKRGGKPSPRQEAISAQLVAHARKGLRVLRLKGGDPFVFGRGGEEALALVRTGIPFRIVPGITAGIGGLAYAGIPATHRDTNHAITFLTGHGADGAPPNCDWDAIAKGSPMLVLYMARKHAGTIAARLIAAGRDRQEPAAIVSNASFANQHTVVTTLGALGAAAADAKTPAIIAIGENVRLAEGLDWLGAMAGRTLNPDPLHKDRLREAS